jgi:predicted AlkP superfamily pyrophosphatase or phosphodiesterase
MIRRRASWSLSFATILLLWSCTGRSLPEVDFERVDYPGPTAAPILLVGIDGLEWGVALPILRNGEMPNLESLMARGTYGLLKTSRPTSSPIIWTTVATGKRGRDHGIRGFLKQDNDDGQKLFTNSDRTTKALWNILSDFRKSVAIVGWWMTYPVERVHGVMVAQTNTTNSGVWKGRLYSGLQRQVWPSIREKDLWSLAEQVEGELPSLVSGIFGDFAHPLSEREQRSWRQTQWAFRADDTYLRVTESLLQEEQSYDLVMTYFGGTDVVGHRFWRYAFPEGFDYPPSKEERDNFGSIIADYYRYTDAAVGRLLAQLSDDWTVIVVSDHGMGPTNRRQKFNGNDFSGHHFGTPPGVFIAAGPAIREMGLVADQLQREDLREIASTFDITPTILTMLRLPLGEDMPGRMIPDLIEKSLSLTDQPERVPTHDTRRFVSSRPEQDSERANDAERLEQLRDLGYIQ